MAAQTLPERPDLDQLKRQAKDLLRSARAGAPAALARFRALPAFAKAGDADLAHAPLALHDAQSVLAREHGFPSWNALRERVEELTLAYEAAAVQLVEAATDGRVERAERLLALHPRLAGATLHTALVLGDDGTVASHLSQDPGLATRAGGPRGWEPLHYVCHTSLAPSPAASPEGLVSIARRLLALGADPNTRFPWLHHHVRRPVLWGATRVTGLLPLAALLLEHGADPNDGVTLPLAAGSGDLETLELLRAHGADANQPWATDGASSLYSILAWADGPRGVRWLLEHGADPDPVFPANGETPLHVVARRWGTDVAGMLVERGADVARPRRDGRTPYAVAALAANREVADWLLEHGAADETPEVDRMVAACGRGDRVEAERMLAGRPALRDEIGPEHYVALHQAAERGDTAALEAMLACGFDPNLPDGEIGKTALHSAAHGGWPDAVRLLLAHGASVAARDNEFHAQPLVWAAESSRGARGTERDYAAVGRLLLDAGSPVDWESPTDEPAEEILEILAEWRRNPSTGE